MTTNPETTGHQTAAASLIERLTDAQWIHHSRVDGGEIAFLDHTPMGIKRLRQLRESLEELEVPVGEPLRTDELVALIAIVRQIE